MSMTKQERTPRAHEVDVLVTIDVPDPATVTAFDEDGFPANSPKRTRRRIHAARD